MSETQAPPISDEEKRIREELAEAAGLNGNGNGHHSNGHEKTTEEKTDPPPGEPAKDPGGFTMFEDLAEETEQDNARKNSTGSQGEKKDPKNPFEDLGPENDVKEEELKSEENITLQEANARVSLYITTLDFAISLICCGIKKDFSIGAQLKYRIHAWRKKAIQIPWVRYVMIPKKRSHPGWGLAGAVFVGTLPVIGMAYMDRLHDEKIQSDPNYAKKHQDEKNKNRHSQFENENSKRYGGPPGPNNEVEDVEYEIVEDPDQDPQGEQQFSDSTKHTRRGRHKESCPKHYDKNSAEPCNCK